MHAIDQEQEQGPQGDHRGDRLAAIERRLARLEQATPPIWWRCTTDLVKLFLADGRSLNAEMVRQGLAWHYVRYAPADRDLARLEAEAKQARRGLWGDPRPVPPWEWRKPATAGSATMATRVVGNLKSRIYHAPNCRSVAAMKPANRVDFGSSGAAESAGYRKAGDCR